MLPRSDGVSAPDARMPEDRRHADMSPPKKPGHAARNLAWAFFSTTMLLAISLLWSWRYFYKLMPVPDAPPLPLPAAPQQISPLQVHYQLDVPGRGEIFPALESERPSDYWPLALLTISNTGDHP